MPASGQRDIDVAQHLIRSERHLKVGHALLEASDEWSAVCYFYGVYHLVRWALRSDPVLNDATALAAINGELAMADKDVTRHHGRRRSPSGRLWGVNELVTLLYRPIAFEYERLHQASIDVRYRSGLRAGPLEDLRTAAQAITSAQTRGQLRAAAVPRS